MIDERLRVVELKQAVLDSQLTALTQALTEATAGLKTVSDAMNKYKGAWAAVLIMGTIFGFFADVAVRMFFEHR